MNHIPPLAGPRRQTANKAMAVASYRPYFELECRLCRMLADSDVLSDAPLVVADVGAAQGLDPRWDIFAPAIRQIGFEPEPQEWSRLQAGLEAEGRGDSHRVLPLALADAPGRRALYVTRDPDASSLYRPNQRFFDRMPDPSGTEIVGQIDVEVTTLDAVSLPHGNDLDVLKLDVQGAELDVLRGAEARLEGEVLAVIAEASFVELYQGQGMFSDLDRQLRSQGFELFDICYRRWSRRRLGATYAGMRVGQMTYGDVLYLKDPLSRDGLFLPSTKLLKLAALAEFFSLPDYALELIDLAREHGDIDEARAATMVEAVAANAIVAYHDRNRLPG